MVTTNFLVKKRKISQLDSVPYTGEYNIDTFHFEFDEEWEGLDKTLVLISGGQRYNIALLNDSALMPFETYQIKGNVQIGLFGTDNGNRVLATGWLPLYIEEDSYEVNTEPENLPSPTQWDLYVTEINGLLNQCRATKEDCEEILNQMQLDYEQYLRELNQIKSDTEDLKDDTQTIHDETNQIKTDVQTLKRQIEQKIDDAYLRINEYNQNAQQKTNRFNQNAEQKTNSFNQNSESKTNTFNQNATEKTNTFNTNANQKTNDYNDNATQKTNTFNENAQKKLDEVTQAGEEAVGNIQTAENQAVSHIQQEGATYEEQIQLLASNYDTKEVTIEGTGTITDAINWYTNSTVKGKTHQVDTNVNFLEGKVFRQGTANGTVNRRRLFCDANVIIEPFVNYTFKTNLDTSIYKYAIGVMGNPYPSNSAASYDSGFQTSSEFNFFADVTGYLGIGIARIDEANLTPASIENFDFELKANLPESIHNVSGDVVIKNSNKNLFDKDTATYVNNKYKNADGLETSSTTSGYLGNYIEVSSQTDYTIQGSLRNATSGIGIYYYDSNKNWISKESIASSSPLPYTFRTPENCKYIQFQYTMQVYDENTVMIEKSDTASNYEPHQGESITFPLSEGQKMYEGDYLADDGIHHVRSQFALSTLNWTLRSDYISATGDYALFKQASYTKDSYKGINYCTHLPVVDSNPTPEKDCIRFIQTTNYGINILINKNIASTVAELKNWLQENNVILEYELAEEIIDQYTEAQQTAWNEIKKMRTYKNITHIYASSDDLAPDVQIKYLQNPLASIEARLDLLEG